MPTGYIAVYDIYKNIGLGFIPQLSRKEDVIDLIYI